MHLRIWHLWGAFLFLLAGCRSEKPAFSFQSTTTVEPAATYASARANTVPAVVPAMRPSYVAKAMAAPFSSRFDNKLVGVKSVILKKIRPALPAAFQLRNKSSEAFQQRKPVSRDKFHLVLGAGLIVGGVVTGLLIGGWLGFGVGTLIVLLGDYFLILGVGGKHAWKEIFQEFFNL